MDLLAEQLLARVLQREVNLTSLLGFVAARDPLPLVRVLDLDDPIHDVKVEVPHPGGSRMDLVLHGPEAAVLAVLELKVAAGEHGDQLERYRSYGEQRGAKTVLADLESPSSAVPQGWQRVGLDDLFEAWVDSTDDTARAFGHAIGSVLRGWRDRASGPWARMSPVMYPSVLRSISPALSLHGDVSHAAMTANGSPSLTTYRAHPSKRERAFLCVDLRCRNKQDPQAPWILRVGVHVDGSTDLAADRRIAHELALALVPVLSEAQIQGFLRARGLPDRTVRAVTSLSPLKRARDLDVRIDEWLAGVDAAGDSRKVARHPLFHHDWGRRLVGMFDLNVEELTSADVTDLVRATLDALHATATISVADGSS